MYGVSDIEMEKKFHSEKEKLKKLKGELERSIKLKQQLNDIKRIVAEIISCSEELVGILPKTEALASNFLPTLESFAHLIVFVSKNIKDEEVVSIFQEDMRKIMDYSFKNSQVNFPYELNKAKACQWLRAKRLWACMNFHPPEISHPPLFGKHKEDVDIFSISEIDCWFKEDEVNAVKTLLDMKNSEDPSAVKIRVLPDLLKLYNKFIKYKMNGSINVFLDKPEDFEACGI